jgi:hypothetical protein
MAGAAVALGLALSGCGQQTLVGEGAMDPEAPQMSVEEAQEEAARLQEEGVGQGTESGAAGGESPSESGSESGGGSGSESHSESGTASGGGSEASEAEASAGSDEGSEATSPETGATGSENAQITDQALAQFEQQFPAIAGVVSEQQLRTTATQVCSAIASGGTAAGQEVAETLPGMTGTTAQQVVGFFDREVCPR